MKKIAIIGYYGYKNFGDNIFVEAALSVLDEVGGSCFKVVVSPEINGTKANYIVPGFISSEMYVKDGLIGKIIRAAFLIRAMLMSDVIINAGGSVACSGASLNKLLLENYIKKIFKRKKIIGIGLSLGPFSSHEDELKIKHIIDLFDLLILRDGMSYETARNIKLDTRYIKGVDLAAVLARKYSLCRGVSDKQYIGVSLMRFDGALGDELDVMKRQIIEFAVKSSMKVRIFVLNLTSDDQAESNEYASDLKEAGVDYELVSADLPVKDVWYKISECSQFLSCRLHGAIAAYLSGVPFYLVRYHEKCESFLDDIGYDSKSKFNLPVENDIKVEPEKYIDGTMTIFEGLAGEI